MKDMKAALSKSLEAEEDTVRSRFEKAERIWRSEEHTSELQSLTNLVCRLLLEKKNIINRIS